jgi:cytochrome c-type biogenesis protein CcmH
MITFIILAAVLTVAVAAVVAVPLLRPATTGARAPWTALAVSVVLAGGAAALYVTLSNWSWSRAAEAENSPQAMVAKLARRLQHHPQDLEGWLMLGRAYTIMNQTELAIRAYEQADRLAQGRSPDALVGLAEALVTQDESSLGGRAGALSERALQLAPHSPKALFFGAAAAVQRGELPLARERFAALLALGPPANVRALIQQQIDAIDQRLASNSSAPGAPLAQSAGPSGDAAHAAAPVTATAAGAPAAVRVKVDLSPKLRALGSGSAPLFVFVRDPKQPGPPLAVKRLETRFPQTVELTAKDAMVAGRALTPGASVEVVARIAVSGSPVAQHGDPFGEAGYQVGHDGVVDVVIDRLTP